MDIGSATVAAASVDDDEPTGLLHCYMSSDEVTNCWCVSETSTVGSVSDTCILLVSLCTYI